MSSDASPRLSTGEGREEEREEGRERGRKSPKLAGFSIFTTALTNEAEERERGEGEREIELGGGGVKQ